MKIISFLLLIVLFQSKLTFCQSENSCFEIISIDSVSMDYYVFCKIRMENGDIKNLLLEDTCYQVTLNEIGTTLCYELVPVSTIKVYNEAVGERISWVTPKIAIQGELIFDIREGVVPYTIRECSPIKQNGDFDSNLPELEGIELDNGR